MADSKKYYYLKLKENFFDSDEMIILESMPDGHLYSNVLLKLYLRSLKNNGKLMFNDRIPYNSTALAQVTRHSVGVIEKSLNIFNELGIIDVLDDGAIYMSDIQNFIGESSTEADRKRIYRTKIEAEKIGNGQMSAECPDKSPPELEKSRVKVNQSRAETQNETPSKKELEGFWGDKVLEYFTKLYSTKELDPDKADAKLESCLILMEKGNIKNKYQYLDSVAKRCIEEFRIKYV